MFEFLSTARSTILGQARPDRQPGQPLVNARMAHLIGEFENALRGLESPEALRLLARIQSTRSKTDLWHLRANVFDLVSRALGQYAAQERMQDLNALFESSGPRTGPIPL
jgi:hypothetical protein